MRNSHVQFGTPLRGAFFNDYNTVRVRDVARIKSTKMLVCRTLVEASLIRPGVVETDDKDASVKMNEDRLNSLRITGVSKAKGKCE